MAKLRIWYANPINSLVLLEVSKIGTFSRLMEEITRKIIARLYQSINELEAEDKQLSEIAIAAMKNAYAPYSDFPVGAAARLDNTEIITGNNQENAALPSSMCGERVAMFAAKSLFPGNKIISLAIATASANIGEELPAAPCGACRQTMVEYEQRDNHPIRIILVNKGGKILVIPSAEYLLPFAFHAGYFKI